MKAIRTIKQAAKLQARLFSSSTTSSATVASRYTNADLNPRVVSAAYAVRGELVIRAERHAAALRAAKQGNTQPTLQFDEIVACNIGNPHELGQQPLTYFRQLISLIQYPALLSHPSISSLYPADVLARAKSYLAGISGGMGAYTSSQGIQMVREEVAAFLQRRDGVKADADQIFLTAGASPAVQMVLNLIIRNNKDGVLTPIPQYPLYSASLALFGGECVKYYLDESNNWGLSLSSLEQSVSGALSSGINPRALVVINPGNPTGQCLPKNTMQQIVKFAEKYNLIILADEVYQTNTYASTPFTSFKQVVAEMNSPASLISFHSISKGFLGECGQRGGYLELHNISSDFKTQIYKLASVQLCANTTGQVMTGLMVNPPKAGEASFALYEKEKNAVLDSLKRRAKVVADTLNTCTGITCNPVEGALYAFPQLRLPAKFVAFAKQQNKPADVVYCLELLDATGICVVPGSGFGQVDGTFHFRTTILPSEAKMANVMKKFKTFHEALIAKYQ